MAKGFGRAPTLVRDYILCDIALSYYFVLFIYAYSVQFNTSNYILFFIINNYKLKLIFCNVGFSISYK